MIFRRCAALALIAAGCGPSAKPGEPKLPPPKTEAVHELEAAARLARLGPTNYPRALERLDAARAIDPNLWEAWYDTGWLLQSTHKLDQAASAYEHAQRLNPQRVQIALALGSDYLERHRFSDAARTFRIFLDQKPPPAPDTERAVRIQLASALRQQGKTDDATEELRKVLRAEPRNASALAGLGLIYEALGRHELAELVIRRAIEVAGDKLPLVAAASWNDLGLVMLSLRRDQEAFAAFDKSAALDPNLAEARFNRAAVFLDCGDYASASKELQKLTEAQPANVEAWVALGVAERGRGKLDDAARAYEHALDLDASAPGALYNMAVLLMDFRKDPASARGYLERFVKAADGSHPKREDAESRLKDLAKSAPPPPAPVAPAAPTKKGGG